MKLSELKLNPKVIAALLAISMVATMAACGGSSDEVEDSSNGSSVSTSTSTSTETDSDDDAEEYIIPETTPNPDMVIQTDSRDTAEIQLHMLAEMQNAMNLAEFPADIVGYLYIPGTSIDQPVVQNLDGNDFYLRRTYLGASDNNGSYFADFRAVLGDRNSISPNVVLYGHSMEDDYNERDFSQLNKFMDLHFATNNQFIYFSTLESDMVWQVFANYYAHVSFLYNTPNLDAATMLNNITQARQSSIMNYNIDVGANDNILTLSTCTYTFDDGKYPNDFRYVVQAKLLPEGAELLPVAVEVNPAPVLPTQGKFAGELPTADEEAAV